jgi:hypothetical protein
MEKIPITEARNKFSHGGHELGIIRGPARNLRGSV